MDDKFTSPCKIKKKYDITSNTLRTWGESGKIRFIRIRDGKGKRLYNVEDVEKILGNSKQSVARKVVCYARVSSDHQKEDLDRQIELLHKSYPEAQIIHDIGSGLNYERKGFETLLEQIHTGTVKQVVVTYKDRVCRFGFELFEWILKKSNTELLVLNPSSEDKSGPQELADDLLSITTFFVARNNGLRSAKFRKQRKEEKEKENKQKEEQVKKD